VNFVLNVLWEITKFLLRRLFDAFGIACLVLSCFAVWRLKTIYDQMFTLTFCNIKWRTRWSERVYSNRIFEGIVILDSHNFPSKLTLFDVEPIMWQFRALIVLCQALFSMVNLLILPFILISPLRWLQMKYSFVGYWSIDAHKDGMNFAIYMDKINENYCAFSAMLPYAVLDIISYPFIAATMFRPEFDFPCIRFPMFHRICDTFSMLFSLSPLPGTRQCEFYDSLIREMEGSCILFTVVILAMRFIATAFIPFAVLTPTAWQSQWHTYSHVNENYRELGGVIAKTAGSCYVLLCALCFVLCALCFVLCALCFVLGVHVNMMIVCLF